MHVFPPQEKKYSEYHSVPEQILKFEHFSQNMGQVIISLLHNSIALRGEPTLKIQHQMEYEQDERLVDPSYQQYIITMVLQLGLFQSLCQLHCDCKCFMLIGCYFFPLCPLKYAVLYSSQMRKLSFQFKLLGFQTLQVPSAVAKYFSSFLFYFILKEG